jgi:phage terminase large subunit-like protein
VQVSPRTKPKARRRRKDESGFTDPHVVKAIGYCRDVGAGKIPACKWVRLACERQLKDLERAKADDFSYRFDEEFAGRAARFLERLPHIKGPKAGELIALEPWQCFLQTTVYGWVRKDVAPGARPLPRFRRVYEEIPRSNGKSIHLSGNALYAFAQGEQGAEIVSGATTREQAGYVYKGAEAMLYKRPVLASKLGLGNSSVAIYQRSTNSVFKALSRDAKKTGDGANIFFAAVDELHAHPTRELWDVLDTGTGKRPTSLIWVITTAGFNTAGICFEKRSYSTKVLEGSVVDESWFAIIYTIDEGDDWADPAAWVKANPNWGISVDVEDFAQKAKRAMQVPSEQTNFLTKHLNVWCNSGRQWIDPKAWDRCADPDLVPEPFENDPCFVGVDLAVKKDVTAKAKLFYRDREETDEAGAQQTRRHYFLFLDFYLPESAVDGSKNSQYSGWAREGRIKVTPGNVVDFSLLRDEFLDDARRYRPREFVWDPWNATQLMSELLEEGLPVVELAPNMKNISPAMKEFEALVLEGRIHHDGNPVMRWMVSNVLAKEDPRGNCFPLKEIPENKIDGVMAALSALARAMVTVDTTVYTADRGLFFVSFDGEDLA